MKGGPSLVSRKKEKQSKVLLTISDMWKPIAITVVANLLISVLAARNVNWSIPYLTPEWVLAGSTAVLAVFTWLLWVANHNMCKSSEHHTALVHRQTLAAERLVTVIERHPHLRAAIVTNISEKRSRRKAA
jgi:hypothetical protein